MVVMEGAKIAEMLYNMCSWFPINGDYMTGQYGSEPEGCQCFSWFMNDKLVFATYVDQLITTQPLNQLEELEHLHSRIWICPFSSMRER